MQSYFGWLKFCNSKNLLRKIQRDTGLRFSNWDGKKSNISRFYNKYIHIVDIVSYSSVLELTLYTIINPITLRVRVGIYSTL